MNARFACTLSVLLATSCAAEAASRWATYRRLGAAQIRKVLVGHQYTDEVHWAERYLPNGTIEGASMGKKFVKNWRIQANTLCIRDAKGEICYEIWRADDTLQFRRLDFDEDPRIGVIKP